MLDWLSPLNSMAKQTDILNRRQEGTGKWITEHSLFKEWVQGPGNRLWCSEMRMRAFCSSMDSN